MVALGGIWRKWGDRSCLVCVVWLVGKNDKSANKIIKFDAIWIAKKI
jgi:hypothetical protein